MSDLYWRAEENREEEGTTIDSFADLAQRIEDKDARRRQRLLDASQIERRIVGGL